MILTLKMKNLDSDAVRDESVYIKEVSVNDDIGDSTKMSVII